MCSGLGAAELDRLTDEELVACAVDLDRGVSRLEAERARVAAAIDARAVHARDGSKSAAAFLARACTRPKARMARSVALGRSLRSMPLADAALRDEEINVDHAAELRRCLLVCAEAYGRDEHLLVRYARALPYDDFARACAYWRQINDPEGAEADAQERLARRRLHAHRLPDGMVAVDGLLDPVTGEAFLDTLEGIESELFAADWAEASERRNGDVRHSDLSRTSAQRRVDALAELVRRAGTAPADGRPPRPLFVVLVDYETVTGRMCELASGTPITPGEAAAWFTEADVQRVVFGPDGHPVEVGRTTRFYRGAVRRAVQARDRHCQWPGCDTPATACEIDHIDPAAAGGATHPRNGRALCAYHHRMRTRLEPPPTAPDDHYAALTRERIRALKRGPTAA